MSRTTVFDFPAATIVFTRAAGGREVVTTISKSDGSSCTVSLELFVETLRKAPEPSPLTPINPRSL